MAGGNNPDAVSSIPNLDPGLYSLLSILIWILFAIIVLYVYRDLIRRLMAALAKRLESSASVKLWNVEFGPIRVSADSLPDNASIKARIDQSLDVERKNIYSSNRSLFIVHRLFPSSVEGQLYDILLYVRPHEGVSASGNLNEVSQVDYYFGSGWGHRVFSSQDRGKRFAIVLSAFGSGFLCFARIHLRDGSSFTTWRYIDFETGALGSDT
jgi:hypothetical protein